VQPEAGVITVDISAHDSDSDVRATLLHEMAHAAAKRSTGHDVYFFAQLEHLLRQGAPIKVAAPEAGCATILDNLVPTRFPLTKKAMDKAEANRVQELDKQYPKAPTIITTESDFLTEVEELAMATMPPISWKQARLVIGLKYGLVDESGRTLRRGASGLLTKAGKAYARARDWCPPVCEK
jgi:hypothetical protein